MKTNHEMKFYEQSTKNILLKERYKGSYLSIMEEIQ